MTIKDDLLSDDAAMISKGLAELDAELRKRRDRSDLLDILAGLCASGDPETVRNVTWCAAKMGQNKVNDPRIVILLTGMAGSGDAQIRENAAWGIGETAGTVRTDDAAMDAISSLLGDAERDVRGMAAWAAGRFRRKCGYMAEDVKKRLNELLNDPSEYVREVARFALDD
ncbi:MAG: HEAT repeat domain-containing protein [Methanomassiliicoccaceae archaeon]|jgi:HEAT repeat protein|nr:HEAT repeat domain-containing protein [Methanomassiliicoccaceae archaeon]